MDSAAFVNLLNSMRLGTLPLSSLSTFSSLARPLPPHPQGLLPTSLYPLRAEVDASNAARLSALPGPSHTFLAADSGKAEPARRRTLLDTLLAPETLHLRAGAQVMLVRNVDAPRGLVNGAVGRVRAFCAPSEIGLRVAGAGPAITGLEMGEDGVVVRVPSGKENVRIGAGKPASAPAKPPVDIKLMSTVVGAGKPPSEAKVRPRPKDDERFPVVEFSTPSGTELVLLLRDEFRVEDADGNLLARRMQVSIACSS